MWARLPEKRGYPGTAVEKEKKKEGVHISGKVQRDKIREIKAEKIVDIAKEEVKARE